jgi:hypothetical protein
MPALEICAPKQEAGMTHEEIVYWQQHHAELVEGGWLCAARLAS